MISDRYYAAKQESVQPSTPLAAVDMNASRVCDFKVKQSCCVG